jgi:hypothetical protein
MSTAVLEPIVEKTVVAEPAKAAATAPVPAEEEKKWSDPHPFLPIFIAGAIAAVIAGGFIGTILIWLAVRHSGVVAP